MVNNFSRNLRHYRIKRNVSQQQLANKLHITRQAISAYEKSTRICDLDTLIKIADIFGITVDELIR